MFEAGLYGSNSVHQCKCRLSYWLLSYQWHDFQLAFEVDPAVIRARSFSLTGAKYWWAIASFAVNRSYRALA